MPRTRRTTPLRYAVTLLKALEGWTRAYNPVVLSNYALANTRNYSWNTSPSRESAVVRNAISEVRRG